MAVQRRPAPPPTTPVDLEETAELPVLDMAAVTGTSVMPQISEDSLSATDVYAGPGVLPVGVAEMAENLRDVEERLHRKAERLATLERELEAAKAAERALRDTLETNTAAARSAAERADAETQQLVEKNRIATTRLEQAEQLLRERESALEANTRELGERATRLEELNTSVAQAAARELEISSARAALVGRSGDLEQQVSQRTKELESERNALANTAASLRSRETQVQRLESQLGELTARSERQLEALRSTEGYKSVSYGLIAEREDEIRALEVQLQQAATQGDADRAQIGLRDGEIAQLNLQAKHAALTIAAHAERITALTSDLALRDKRIGDLERGQAAAERNAEAKTEALRLASEHAAELDSRLAAEKLRATTLAADVTKAQADIAAQKLSAAAELAKLKASTSAEFDKLKATTTAELDKLKASAAVELDKLKATEASHAAATAQGVQLTEQLAAEARRSAGLITELEELRVTLASERDATKAEADKYAAREEEFNRGAEKEKAFNDLLNDQQEIIGKVNAELLEAGQRGKQLEEDLRLAELQVSRVETDLRHRDSRIDELTRSAEATQTRLTAAEKSLAEREDQVKRMESEAHANAAVLGNIQQSIQRLGREDTGTQPTVADVPLESLARLLVRQESGGSEIVHMLTRRTTVGRTPDNDIQIDTTFISRHHAVVLVSARHTIIEDLNSTNGVLVNGRKVSRHALHDGDKVTIGKTEFRYQLKPLGSSGSPA